MVDGIESFKAKFIGYEDCYTVIGGAACDILMTEADMDFRQTKDIDMILILITGFVLFFYPEVIALFLFCCSSDRMITLHP